MKKQMISICLALLLLFSLLPAAYGDMTYGAPGDVEAGSQLEFLAATVSGDSSVSVQEDTLPEGVSLRTELTGEGQNVYLFGVPLEVGTYHCVINIDGAGGHNAIVCPLTVVPGAPTVTACDPVHCYVGEEAQVSVEAYSNDGGRLSYQWYSNTVLNSTNGALIRDATEPVLRVPTDTAGTTYYYCVVTNTNGGQTVTVTSNIIPVTVSDMVVVSITVETLPRKTSYTVGDTLDSSGLSIRARYSNNSSMVITEGFTVEPTWLYTEGVQNVTVYYQGLSCTFQVTVKAQEEVIEGIGVLTLPDKRSYSVGDRLETAGLSIRVYTNQGHRDVTAEELTCSPMVFDKAGAQVITVSYGGKTCTFTLQIEEGEHPVRLFPSTLPTKIQYTVGDTLDTTGLTLTVVSSKNNQEQISSGFTCTPTLLNTVGTTQIVVTYGDLSCSFNVSVAAPVFASPSPSPAGTPAPAQTPQVQAPVVTAPPSPTSHVVEHQPHETGGTALFVVLIVASLLALLGLGAYVYIANRGGLEQLSEDLRRLKERIRDRFGGE